MQTSNTARQKPRNIPKRKVKTSYSKKYVLEKTQSCILSPRIGPAPLSVRCEAVWTMDARWSGYLSPLVGNHRVI